MGTSKVRVVNVPRQANLTCAPRVTVWMSMVAHGSTAEQIANAAIDDDTVHNWQLQLLKQGYISEYPFNQRKDSSIKGD